VNKILGVAIVGGLLLFLVLRYATGNHGAAIGPDPAAASASVASANVAVTIAPPPVTATSALAPAPAAPIVSVAGDVAACARLADLCSTSDQKFDSNDCQKQLTDARKMAGAGNVERSERCLSDAKTCAAASGCMSGGVGMGAMGEFLKGLGGALSK
jgi:hypothetical protein